MNICILMGKIVENIEFKFIYNDKRISVAYTTIMLLNKSKVKIKGYTEKADEMYRKLRFGDVIVAEGKLNTKMEVEIEKITIIPHLH